MRVEDLKDWLAGTEREEEAEKGGGRAQGAGGHVAPTHQVGPAHLEHGRDPAPDVAHNHYADSQK